MERYISDSFTINDLPEPNQKPTASPQAVAVAKNSSIAITLIGADGDGDALSYALDTNPSHGTVVIVGNVATYTPTAGFWGTDSFTFKTNDGKEDSVSARVSIAVNNTGAIPNNAPTANAQTITMDEDTNKAILLTGADADGDALSFSVIGLPSHGTLSGTTPNLTYKPNPNYAGEDSFTFKTNDDKSDSIPATVHITINNIREPLKTSLRVE